jgi:hypothetical protein
LAVNGLGSGVVASVDPQAEMDQQIEPVGKFQEAWSIRQAETGIATRALA